MKFQKILISLTLLLVTYVFITLLLSPLGSLSLVAASTDTFTVLRAVTIGVLFCLLITNPPRTTVLKALIGVWAIALFVVTLYLFASYQLLILDAIILIEVAIICTIEALEAKRVIPVSKKYTPSKRIKVLSM